MVAITTPFIQLDQFLKWAAIADSGGQAKAMIAAGLIRVNGEITYERRKKLYPGDRIERQSGGLWQVTAAALQP